MKTIKAPCIIIIEKLNILANRIKTPELCINVTTPNLYGSMMTARGSVENPTDARITIDFECSTKNITITFREAADFVTAAGHL